MVDTEIHHKKYTTYMTFLRQYSQSVFNFDGYIQQHRKDQTPACVYTQIFSVSEVNMPIEFCKSRIKLPTAHRILEEKGI